MNAKCTRNETEQQKDNETVAARHTAQSSRKPCTTMHRSHQQSWHGRVPFQKCQSSTPKGLLNTVVESLLFGKSQFCFSCYSSRNLRAPDDRKPISMRAVTCTRARTHTHTEPQWKYSYSKDYKFTLLYFLFIFVSLCFIFILELLYVYFY
jgi:hypothetical protein